MFGLFTGLLSVTPAVKDVAGAVIAVAPAPADAATAGSAVADAVQKAKESDRA